jgi:hypothetical protein
VCLCNDNYDHHASLLCNHFKNKANFVELPCKVGDYIEWDKGGGIGKTLYQVKGFLYYENSLRYVLDFFEPVVTHQAITGILTKEEAEQKLKGGADNG